MPLLDEIKLSFLLHGDKSEDELAELIDDVLAAKWTGHIVGVNKATTVYFGESQPVVISTQVDVLVLPRSKA